MHSYEIGLAIGATCEAIDLARDAWNCAFGNANGFMVAEGDAEAAMMLSEGWSPGDQLVRLGGAT